MVEMRELWSLAEETMRAFQPFYREATQKAIEDSGVPDHWFALRLARGSDPAPFTVECFHTLYPYTAQQRQAEILEDLAQLDLLEKVGERAYRLTGRGSEAVESIFKAAHRALGTIDPLPAGEMDRLNDLLYRLVEATLQAPEPEDKRAISYSRWTDPGENASGAARTDQYLTDLYCFRDDAHLAAWRRHDVSGHIWEALTFLWRGDARTAEELAEKLPRRGHSVEAYTEALDDLAGRGWIEETPDGYQSTAQGRALRQEAEDATDRYFFAPWACLNDAEKIQLHTLLTRLRDNLQKMAESEADST